MVIRYMASKSTAENKILGYFFINPHAKQYVNELARMLGIDPKNTHRKLLELEERGVLKSEFMGQQRYFYFSKSPLAKNYQKIFLQTAGLERQLKDIMAADDKIIEAYIFGSYAKDNMDSSSDVDVLVIGDHSSIKLYGALGKIQQEIGREINVVNLSEAEFKSRKKTGDNFLKNIFSGKIIKIK